MGWASGSYLAENIWKIVRNHLPEDKRKEIAKKIIKQFEQHDCDTIDEAEKLCKDAGREPYVAE